LSWLSSQSVVVDEDDVPFRHQGSYWPRADYGTCCPSPHNHQRGPRRCAAAADVVVVGDASELGTSFGGRNDAAVVAVVAVAVGIVGVDDDALGSVGSVPEAEWTIAVRAEGILEGTVRSRDWLRFEWLSRCWCCSSVVPRRGRWERRSHLKTKR